MDRRRFMQLLAGASAAGVVIGCSSEGSASAQPRILLAGDSVAHQYAPYFIAALKNTATVDSIAVPGAASIDLTTHLEELHAEGNYWDLVLVNACLNDYGRMAMDPADHRHAALALIDAAAAVCDHWMWVSTTPVLIPIVARAIPVANDMARGWCAQRGGTYLEGGEFVSAFGHSAIRNDYIHPTEEVARQLGEFLALEVADYMEANKRSDTDSPRLPQQA